MGCISVKWNRAMNKNKTLQLDIPKGMEVKLDVESLKIPHGKSLRINGVEISMVSYYTISSGKWEVVF